MCVVISARVRRSVCFPGCGTQSVKDTRSFEDFVTLWPVWATLRDHSSRASVCESLRPCLTPENRSGVNVRVLDKTGDNICPGRNTWTGKLSTAKTKYKGGEGRSFGSPKAGYVNFPGPAGVGAPAEGLRVDLRRKFSGFQAPRSESQERRRYAGLRRTSGDDWGRSGPAGGARSSHYAHSGSGRNGTAAMLALTGRSVATQIPSLSEYSRRGAHPPFDKVAAAGGCWNWEIGPRTMVASPDVQRTGQPGPGHRRRARRPPRRVQRSRPPMMQRVMTVVAPMPAAAAIPPAAADRRAPTIGA